MTAAETIRGMLDDLSADHDQPRYHQVAGAVRSAVANGSFPIGMRLPAERDLARDLRISRTTVVAAYEQLRREQVVVSRRGSGTYVRGGSPTDWQSLLLVPSDQQGAKSSAASQVEFTAAAFTAKGILDRDLVSRFNRELEDLETHHGYSVAGLPKLRSLIAQRLSRSHLPTTANQVMVTSGAQQAIHLVASLCVGNGEVALIEDPAWVGALDALKSQHANIRSIPVDRAGGDVDVVAAVAARQRVRLIYTSPSFQNPTGAQLSDDRRRTLASAVKEFGIALIEDNTLTELSLGGEELPPVAAYSREAEIYTIGSLSKVMWGGLRIGWVRASEEAITRLIQLKLVFDHGTSLISQALAIAALQDFDSIRRARIDRARSNLGVLEKALNARLPQWSWQHPAGGLCIWVRLPRGNAAEFALLADRHGVRVVPGTVASASHSHGDCLRLPYASDPTLLVQGVDRLSHAWVEYAGTIDHRRIQQPVL